MPKSIITIASFAIFAGCQRAPEPATDREHRPLPGMTKKCAEITRSRGLEAAVPLWSVDQCFRMTSPQRWRGLWRRAFEQSQFCPGDVSDCSLNDKPSIWLDVHDEAGLKSMATDDGISLYRVEFIGRRTLVPYRYFGHLNRYDHEMIVDRMISAEAVPDKEDN